MQHIGETMGKKLTNAPVYYTLAQVQFNPILDLEGFIPAIQAKMRAARFPDFKQELGQRLVFPFGEAPSVTHQSRYYFGDIAGHTNFLLDNNALTFQSTSYDTFESFSGAMLTGLTILHDALNLDFIERIGLRYLDAIQPITGETLREYLVPEVLGHSMSSNCQLQHSASETIVTISTSIQLISRVLIRNGQIGLPQELSELAPSIAPRFLQSNGLHAIVDTDAFTAQREEFNVASVGVQLNALHTEIAKFFNATVTEHALATWA